ncbi:saccharopine dehydrogenase NADP-binding domain-containing protein [candidate division TA06 bacterium]|uniref:Saccharopine dehydrogenase NADP-binding domain-containing protein n=1 Tax=candidate division TA06 bacterium TaxID=2250710 RepID=A0A933MIW2_UNCT6|nr:saccharopine dehydrogenase NADP-binding domain-containing protein [candidate division TA06 bacterium]
MKYKYIVLGAGRQGVAIAYDLAKFCQARSVILADYDLKLAKQGAARVNKLVKHGIAKAAKAVKADAGDQSALKKLFAGTDCVVSAVPYHYNYDVAKAAVEAGANFCDLGGNTGVVLKELSLHKKAKAKGITIVPDTGLMPGMGNTFAAYFINKLDKVGEIHLRCGGLPQKPKPPLNYKLVFSVEGLINEYFGEAYIVKNGKVAKVPAFDGLEALEFPKPVGRCEAFVTSGGTSTAPWTFAGQVKEYDYKTVRYPGHHQKIKTLLELGFFDQAPLDVKGQRVIPRHLSQALITKAIDFPRDKDLIVLRVTALGKLNGQKVEARIDIVDFHDDQTGFTAMERTTGFPAAIVAHHLAQGLAPRGAVPLEKAIDPVLFIKDFKKRGIPVKETLRKI